MASESGCSHIAIGHTTTDKAETMLLNLIRYSHCGMQACQKGNSVASDYLQQHTILELAGMGSL
jgi:tRNA(Ile)-lysidine synthase TilS/MesJ